jgi:isopentenyl diphosphate isomerase/L-lactate dehydrogenase-like FMN-dependent dehydrogenase
MRSERHVVSDEVGRWLRNSTRRRLLSTGVDEVIDR